MGEFPGSRGRYSVQSPSNAATLTDAFGRSAPPPLPITLSEYDSSLFSGFCRRGGDVDDGRDLTRANSILDIFTYRLQGDTFGLRFGYVEFVLFVPLSDRFCLGR